MDEGWFYEYEVWVWCGVVALLIVIMFIATWFDGRESKRFRKKVGICRWKGEGSQLVCDCIYCLNKHGGPAVYNSDNDYEWCPYCGRPMIKEGGE